MFKIKAFTCLVKHFRSDSSQAKLTQSPAQSSQTKLRSYGFTLAETMIVLAVLGVIAVVTVPALVNKHIESTNRTKIKKAMTVYDTALNKMVIENGIKDNAALYENANSFAPENDCTNTAPYFKVSTTLNNNPCTFKAPDGLFWNISKINAPIIAFSEADLNNANAENRYQLVGHFDNTTGSLRVNDLQYETDANNKAALTKVYNYINNVKNSNDDIAMGSGSEYGSEINNKDVFSTIKSLPICNGSNYPCITVNGGFADDKVIISVYDSQRKLVIDYMGMCSADMQTCGESYVVVGDGNVDHYEGCDNNGDNCTFCQPQRMNGCPPKSADGHYHPGFTIDKIYASGSGSGSGSGW